MTGLASLITRQVTLIAVTGAAAVALWVALLEVFSVNPLIGARPWAVVAYLFDPDNGVERRDLLTGQLGETLVHAALGGVLAMLLAWLIAAAFTLVTPLDTAFTPLLLVLRTLPIIVLTPVITLVVGNGLGAVVVIVFLAVFFPVVIVILQGMRSAKAVHIDLFAAYGGTRARRFLDLDALVALPSVTAALRIAIPVAVTGAMLAEWLATGDGLGGAISRAAGSFNYVSMWAAMVAITVCTVVVYSSATVLDAAITQRFGGRADA